MAGKKKAATNFVTIRRQIIVNGYLWFRAGDEVKIIEDNDRLGVLVNNPVNNERIVNLFEHEIVR